MLKSCRKKIFSVNNGQIIQGKLINNNINQIKENKTGHSRNVRMWQL